MVIVKAIFDYNGLVDHKIQFSKGDIFELVDDADPNWWHVILPRSGEQDIPEHIYVPATYVTKVVELEPNGFNDVSGFIVYILYTYLFIIFLYYLYTFILIIMCFKLYYLLKTTHKIQTSNNAEIKVRKLKPQFSYCAISPDIFTHISIRFNLKITVQSKHDVLGVNLILSLYLPQLGQ